MAALLPWQQEQAEEQERRLDEEENNAYRMIMTAEQEWKGKVKNDEDEDVQLPSSLSIQAEWDKPLIQ